MTRLPRWRKAEPLAKSYLGNTLHILGASAANLWYSSSPRCCSLPMVHLTFCWQALVTLVSAPLQAT